MIPAMIPAITAARMTPRTMVRPALAALLLLLLLLPAALTVRADDSPPADRAFRFTPSQNAAVQRLEARLVDGDTSRQIHTARLAARACFAAALQHSAPRGAARDRNGLAERHRDVFVDCVRDAGYQLR